jgi:hypothetical protein
VSAKAKKYWKEFFMEEKTQRRVRINLSQTAKGLVQFDCTAEFETPEDCGAALSSAIDEARSIIAAKGLKEAGE